MLGLTAPPLLGVYITVMLGLTAPPLLGVYITVTTSGYSKLGYSVCTWSSVGNLVHHYRYGR